MGKSLFTIIGGLMCAALLSACGQATHEKRLTAPKPPKIHHQETLIVYQNIIPAVGETTQAQSLQHDTDKSCSFSRFHRGHAVGYEIDPSRHIGLTVSPRMDVWNPADIDTKVSLRFTKALGGIANSRPDCTFGQGFYGLVPYASNKGKLPIGSLLKKNEVKSYFERRLQAQQDRPDYQNNYDI
jgi:hypothetical protein